MARCSYAVAISVALLAFGSSQSAQKGKDQPKITLDIILVEEGNPPAQSVVIHDVTPRGVGYRMGLVKGDVILGINGRTIKSTDRVKELLQNQSATIIWKGKDGTHYRNTVRIAAKVGPPGPPAIIISEMEQGKSMREFEKKSDKQEAIPVDVIKPK